MLKLFRRVQSQDRDLANVQSAVEQVINPIARIPFLDGTPLGAVALTTTATKIPHNLNRQPLGWYVTDRNANAAVYRTSWTDTTITLTASATCTVDIWIY